MRTFEEILRNAAGIKLTHSQYYWAHIHPSRTPEQLTAHILLVNEYFLHLLESHGLERIIDRLINEYVGGWSENKEVAGFMKLLFAHVVLFHDFGKVNENFQALRMGNSTRFKQNARTILKPVYGHSFLSSFIYIGYHIDLIVALDVSDGIKQILIAHCFFLSYSIMHHHSPVLTDATSTSFLVTFKDVSKELEIYLRQYNMGVNIEMLSSVLRNMDNIWESITDCSPDIISFPLFALIKLNFSMLTASDYLASHEYMHSSMGGEEGRTKDIGIFTKRDRIGEIVNHLQSYKHNNKIFPKVTDYVFLHPLERSNENLNQLRQEMAIELIQTVRQNLHKKLFYIEAPTGGGKTNLSFITVTELLSANPELNKVFYVFPFTTLITQTYLALKETLGLHEDEIVEMHSKAGFSSKLEIQQDGVYGDEKKDYIDNLFALYPVTLLSHVKFFDILKTNRKEANYLFHRLANSIVVIDEIQSYNPIIWDKMLYFISQYSKIFNMRFVLMSATLPKISDLNIGLMQKPQFVDLLPNARKYITNNNFSQRVTFNFGLIKEEIKINDLAQNIISKSKLFIEKHGSVKTIVEFIYKKSASAFEKTIAALGHPFDKVFVLSGTILESRRREIINFIKKTANSRLNILLITTQVIEAGVDIDMDLGFKNISLIDSDEQLAGRVNRNATKYGCEVYLFKLDDARILYGKDYRYRQTRENITTLEHEEILKSKDFKKLYEHVITHIDETNKPIFKDSLSGYESALIKLRFNEVDRDFKIIDQYNESIFVPLRIPVYVEGTCANQMDEIFSSKDLLFLNQMGVIPKDNFLDGKEVWNVYEDLINNGIQKRKNKDGFDLKGKVDFKILQSIMSKFIFSLMLNSRDYQSVQSGFGEEKFGYMYFSGWNEDRTEGKPYSYESGLNSAAFSDSNFI